jgi:BirA family biotin operon repressor/biotin-[acetyl-CoA-carboxylase] ligase
MGAHSGADSFTVQALQAGLRTRQVGRTVHLFYVADSTNLVASRLAQDGAPHGTVIVAERQTSGRGRLGRSWFSPAGQGLYCSILLRTDSVTSLARRLSWVPLVSGMATARAIQQTTGLDVRLKWPNDLELGDRKVGGLLCETGRDRAVGGAASHVIVGVGLNINTALDTFPKDLRAMATSLAIATGRPVDRLGILTATLNELEIAVDHLATLTDTDLVQAYTTMCTTIGRRVKLEFAGRETVTGLAQGIGLDGSLRVIREGTEAGSTVEVRAGDVVHVR